MNIRGMGLGLLFILLQTSFMDGADVKARREDELAQIKRDREALGWKIAACRVAFASGVDFQEKRDVEALRIHCSSHCLSPVHVLNAVTDVYSPSTHNNIRGKAIFDLCTSILSSQKLGKKESEVGEDEENSQEREDGIGDKEEKREDDELECIFDMDEVSVD